MVTVELHCGDCLEVMKGFDDNSVDTVITDPPYALTSGDNATGGFMGKQWDSEIPGVDVWKECLRVAKPGAFLLAFGGTRTFHRLVCAIEDAGWEIRDTISFLHDGIPLTSPILWLHGQGFPKSMSVSKALDKMAGAEREVIGIKPGHEEFANRGNLSSVQSFKGTLGGDGGFSRPWMDDPDKVESYHHLTAPATDAAKLFAGYGTALKPSVELICVAMKPVDSTFANNALTWGVAGLNIDGSRVPTDGSRTMKTGRSCKDGGTVNSTDYGEFAALDGQYKTVSQGRWPANLILGYSEDSYILRPNIPSSDLRDLVDWVDENLHGFADINVKSFEMMPEKLQGLFVRVESRGKEGVLECFPGNAGGRWGKHNGQHPDSMFWGDGPSRSDDIAGQCKRFVGDFGSAARFFQHCPWTEEDRRVFYCPKASRSERNEGLEGMPERKSADDGYGSIQQPKLDRAAPRENWTPHKTQNHHPTCKPLRLMEYLCNLTKTPTGGTILDPFLGSGTTGIAAIRTGRSFIGIELDPDYFEIAQARIAHEQSKDRQLELL